MKQLDVVHTTTIIKFQKLSSICIKCNINQEFQQIKKNIHINNQVQYKFKIYINISIIKYDINSRITMKCNDNKACNINYNKQNRNITPL